jgi:hypothetical protein
MMCVRCVLMLLRSLPLRRFIVVRVLAWSLVGGNLASDTE